MFFCRQLHVLLLSVVAAMSRKLIICLLASMVMRNPLLLKMRHISFMMFSVSLGVALVIASPSSR